MIELNGTRVPGHDMRVRGNFRIEEKDLSGQSSASDTAEEGIKPQTLSVSLTIRFDDETDLNKLIALARAVDENGQRVIYDINNRTARAANIRQVKFSENFTYQDNDNQRSWQVNFTLREFLSVPEKVEARQEPTVAQEQTTEGETVATPEPTPEPQQQEPQQQEQEYSGFKGVLKKLDSKLGSDA